MGKETLSEKRARAGKESHKPAAKKKRETTFKHSMALKQRIKDHHKELQKVKVDRFALRVFDGERKDKMGRPVPFCCSAVSYKMFAGQVELEYTLFRKRIPQ